MLIANVPKAVQIFLLLSSYKGLQKPKVPQLNSAVLPKYRMCFPDFCSYSCCTPDYQIESTLTGCRHHVHKSVRPADVKCPMKTSLHKGLQFVAGNINHERGILASYRDWMSEK